MRDTDYQHMKNGFARFLVARFNSQKENLTEEEQSEFTTALNDFKRAFPKGHVAKGARLIFLASNGTISITHEDKPFGTVSSKLFTRYFVEGYINPKFSMSPNFCSKVAQGLCRAE